MQQRLTIPLVMLTCLSTGLQLLAEDDKELTFEADIRPIFRAHCFDCHGATEEKEAGLDLRLVRFLKTGGESGPAVTLDDPDASLLLERIQSGEMPPGENRVPEAEIQIISNWIKAGAKTARPEPEMIGPGLGVTIEERSHWAYQPINSPQIPDLSTFPTDARVRTPIDALLLDEHGFTADASRRVLVMRAYFDLTGLPPGPEDVVRWQNDPEADWYDRMLTELLASEHYGEFWGRHWLDVAGYADSEGYTVADAERPWAWKYRDWVIRSLNQDLPFDQFITHQLAGDELAGLIQGDLTNEQIDLLTATGFLRMAADGTGSGADNPEGRNQVVTDTLKIIGTSLLGLSLQCAQCHDHRYDPIPQTDYYAIRAIFEPALDWQSWKQPNARRVSLYTAADRAAAAKVEEEVKVVAKEKATKLAEYMKQAIDAELKKFEEPLRTELRTAYETPAKERTDAHKELLSKNPSVNITPGNLYQYIPDSRPKLAEFDKKIGEIRAKKPTEEFLRVLMEPAGHVPETKLFHRGDYRQPKAAVAPAGLVVLSPENAPPFLPVNDESLPTTGRRLAFAKWLTSPRNPIFARVIVNRVWMHHFGKGLVATPADFGKLGAAPDHPELLDWLAAEFIAQGWSLKSLHRLIMTSTAWRQRAYQSGDDPSESITTPNPALARLEAENLRDRMLTVSGSLDRTQFGPPLKIKEDETGQVIVDGDQTRRSLYIKSRRSQPVAMMQTFDAPVMETNCERRSSSTVATQSLVLLNGEFILKQAAKLADRVAVEAGPFTSRLSPSDIELIKKLQKSLPQPSGSAWQYGVGAYDQQNDRTGTFTELKHWTGSQWQAGAALPDPQSGWVLLHASGGHPDIGERGVIRRWTAQVAGTVTISGKLGHGSENGDGVRGRIVSSQSGKLGEWTVHNSSADTPVAKLNLQQGETIDFIIDCREHQTSDSFSWPVTVVLTTADNQQMSFASAEQFRGPGESLDVIPNQIVRAWELAYCRTPTSDEISLAMTFFAQQLQTLEADPARIPTGRTGIRQTLTNLCQTLMSSNEFLYVE